MECASPFIEDEYISLSHGSGGLASSKLIESVFYAAFDNHILNQQADSAILAFEALEGSQQLAFTTDTYVVNPLFFPGGDIGQLAVCGTLNDLAMVGAKPLFLSAGFILEEGLAMRTLQQIVDSMALTARAHGVQIVTGDTKVVEKGAADQIYINTTGIGIKQVSHSISPKAIRCGDKVILTGDLGRHGMAVMCQREGLEFESQIQSDVACLYPAIATLLEQQVAIHCMRDLTRGGLGSVLNELSQSSAHSIKVNESEIPIHSEVRAATELLGLDPLYVANEGCCLIVVPEHEATHTLSLLKEVEVSAQARCIGTVLQTSSRPQVILHSIYGAERILPHLSGIQLPRIC